MTNCKICNSSSEEIFTERVLNQYSVKYFKCTNCGFIQTEEPYWLDESYADAITSMDIGLISRNIDYSQKVEEIIYQNFDCNGKFLDFAGGYGMFTRLMRDKGFDYYHQDKYCDNLFAAKFTIDDLPKEDQRFELITAFELMEHLTNPYTELDQIFSMTDTFVFTTELVPSHGYENWWYIMPEHGQHISFYTPKALEFIASKYNKHVYTNSALHIITDKNNPNILTETKATFDKLHKILNKVEQKYVTQKPKLKTKLQSDFQMLRDNLSKKL